MRRGLAEHDRDVGWPQRGILGERALDGARHPAQLSFGVGRSVRADRGRAGLRRRLFSLRPGDELLDPFRSPARPFAAFGVERDRHLGALGERREQSDLRGTQQLERIDQDEARHVRRLLDRVRSDCSCFAGITPAVVVEGSAIGRVNVGQREVVGARGAPCRAT